MFHHRASLVYATLSAMALTLSGCSGSSESESESERRSLAAEGVLSLIPGQADVEGTVENREDGIALVTLTSGGVTFGYGGWLGKSGFVVGLVDDEIVTNFGGVEESSTDPDPNADGFTASWRGVMVGVDTDMDYGRVEGDAGLTLEALQGMSPVVDVAFTHVTGNGRNYDDHNWDDVSLSGGRFDSGMTESNGQVEGQFHGANHEEVVGTFQYDSLVGGYGALRMREIRETENGGGNDGNDANDGMMSGIGGGNDANDDMTSGIGDANDGMTSGIGDANGGTTPAELGGGSDAFDGLGSESLDRAVEDETTLPVACDDAVPPNCHEMGEMGSGVPMDGDDGDDEMDSGGV